MFTNLSDRNLLLTGYSGRNPLALGRAAAALLKLKFVDYGQRFEQLAEMTPEQVRETFGEARQRTLEYQLADEFALYRATVIHIRGSTLAKGDMYARLRESSIPVCVIATLDAVLSRLHLTMGLRYHDPREREIAIGEVRREWAARTLPGIIPLNITAMSDAQAAEAAADLWRKATGALNFRG